MDNNVISTLIHQHCPKLSHLFVGCFSCNNFPIIKTHGQFQIVNTDPVKKTGQHWILIGSYHDLVDGEMNKGPTVFYFDSLNTHTKEQYGFIDDVPYTCIKQRLKKFYGNTRTNFDVLRPYDFGVTPQDPETSTCGLYCIYMAHLIYLDVQTNYVTEDDVLQFAHEHFDNKFVKQLLYL